MSELQKVVIGQLYMQLDPYACEHTPIMLVANGTTYAQNQTESTIFAYCLFWSKAIFIKLLLLLFI